MVLLPFVLALSFHQITEQDLITGAALVLLALSIALVIWPKFVELVHAVWTSFKSAVREVLTFYDEIKQRPQSPRARPSDAGLSPASESVGEYPLGNRSG